MHAKKHVCHFRDIGNLKREKLLNWPRGGSCCSPVSRLQLKHHKSYKCCLEFIIHFYFDSLYFTCITLILKQENEITFSEKYKKRKIQEAEDSGEKYKKEKIYDSNTYSHRVR